MNYADVSIAGDRSGNGARVVTAGRDNGKRRSRPVGYAPWSPRGETREMLDRILSVLDDHREYWPITPRQVLYRLMGRGEATKQDAERIGEYLNRGRRSGAGRMGGGR